MTTARQHVLSPAELEALMAHAIGQSRADMKKLINEVLDERQELVGHPNRTPEERAENRADAEFVRDWRLKIEAVANAIGKAVLTAIGAGALFLGGIGARKLGWW